MRESSTLLNQHTKEKENVFPVLIRCNNKLKTEPWTHVKNVSTEGKTSKEKNGAEKQNSAVPSQYYPRAF